MPEENDNTTENSSFLPRKSHVVCGLLAIFLGVFGIHKFYLGYTRAGFIMLTVSVMGVALTFSLATILMALVGIIEGIAYLVTRQEDFKRVYVDGVREWF
ncbi:MAG: TM2 domain-containing protein [Eggerthellaceae bacterium]|nr:TM2 domain-containing protein [Eggerthellaceae bacterium]